MTVKAYYNNSCSVCKLEVNHYKKIPQVDIDWIDITENKLAQAMLKKTDAELIRRMHVTENGKLYKGADAFIKIWSKIPRYKFLSKILGTQPILLVFKCVYEILALLLFLKNKSQIKKNG